jgi:hypothetical protein
MIVPLINKRRILLHGLYLSISSFIQVFNNSKKCSNSTVQYSTAQYSTVQYSTAQYSTVQYSTAQYSTVQYSTAQYSTVLQLRVFGKQGQTAMSRTARATHSRSAHTRKMRETMALLSSAVERDEQGQKQSGIKPTHAFQLLPTWFDGKEAD